jgi:hypothetical protein
LAQAVLGRQIQAAVVAVGLQQDLLLLRVETADRVL